MSIDPKHEAKMQLDAMLTVLKNIPKGDVASTYDSRPSDIVIATFPKAGTTLLQNMCYQIAVQTGAAPSFDPTGTEFSDIEEVVPWLDSVDVTGIQECDTTPRLFKTHRPAEEFEKKNNKFIICIRDPASFPSSYLDFLFDWVLGDEATKNEKTRYEAVQEVARRKLLCEVEGTVAHGKYANWNDWVNGWISRIDENTLVLFYEDVIIDYSGTARKIARFMGVDLGTEGLKVVVERCNRNVMAESTKFRCNIWGAAVGLDMSRGGSKASKADRIGFKKFAVEDEILRRHADVMQDIFGVRCYAELKDVITEKCMNVANGLDNNQM